VFLGHEVGDGLQEELLQITVPKEIVALDVDLDLVGFGLFLFNLMLVNYLLSFSHLCCFSFFFYQTKIFSC
jgi:hypothetical protein